MKILLNPKYEALRPWIEKLDDRFEHEGKVIHSGRNLIKMLPGPDGRMLCVKRYAEAGLLRRIGVRLLRTPKGKRAYRVPMLLRERGLESPESVAFVKVNKSLLRRRTYLVSLYSTYRYRLDGLARRPDAERREVAEAFARYVARLHRNGFLHHDFSMDNVLYDRVGERYHFALVDTNHVRRGRAVSLEKGCRNLAALGADESFYDVLAQKYAEERRADPEHVRELIEAERHSRNT